MAKKKKDTIVISLTPAEQKRLAALVRRAKRSAVQAERLAREVVQQEKREKDWFESHRL